MVPIEKECNKNGFSRCSIDKEASSLMEDEKVEVVAELAAKGLKKEQFLGRRSIIGILSFALTVLCSLALFILIKSDLKRKIVLPEKENQTDLDACKYNIFFSKKKYKSKLKWMYFVSKFSININRDFIIDHKRYLESWITIDDYVRNHNQSSLRL